MFLSRLLVWRCLIFFALVLSGWAWAQPRVAVSIAPLHSLVAGVMSGVAEPELVYRSSQSPHASALAPDQLKTLVRADLLIWVGPELETGLSRLLGRRPEDALEMRWHDYDAGMRLHSQREPLFDSVGSGADEHGHDHGDLDPHFWLSPANARHFVQAVADRLGQLDPDHQSTYQGNAERINKQLMALEQRLTEQLAPVKDQPYILFHDGFQYFDRAFELNALGALVLNPELPPGPRTVDNLKTAARKHAGVCLFHEPQFSDRWLTSLKSALPSARIAAIDPLGVEHAPGETLYQSMILQLATDMVDCLEGLQ